MDGMCIVIILVLALLVIALLYRPSRDGFAVGNRIEMPCPLVSDLEKELLPNTVIFVVQGYNYETLPVIYRDGLPVIPQQLNQDFANLTYYYTIQVPGGRDKLLDYEWELATQQKITPLVTEGYSQIRFDAVLKNDHPGRLRWALIPMV